MATVKRRLTIKLVPIGPTKFAVTINDGTTRSADGGRSVEAEISTDSYDLDSVPEALGMIFAGFRKSLEQEDQGELFAGVTSAKPVIEE
jgi:hypothetical protein